MEEFPIEFKKGEQYAFSLLYVNNDGSAFSESTGTVTCQFTIKESYDSATTDVLLTKGAGITYTQSTGEFLVVIPSSDTANIDWDKGVYDMWINSSTNGKDYVLDGTVTVIPNVG
jgi:hypothetical protein